MDDSLPKIQIVKKQATSALSDLKNNPPGGPTPSGIVPHGKEIIKQTEEISEYMHGPEVPPELKEHGVEQVSETVELPPEVKKAGVETVDSLAVFEPPKENLIAKVPLTTQQMQKGLHAKMADSILWFVYWCIRQIQMGKVKNQ